MEKVQEEMCRLCLQISSDMENVYNYTKAIRDSTGIQVTDELEEFPKKICFECLSSVFLTCNFKEKCLKIDNWLQEENNSKTIQQNEEIEKKFEIGDESIQNNVIKNEINYENPELENNNCSIDRCSNMSGKEAIPLPDDDVKVVVKEKPKWKIKRKAKKHHFKPKKRRNQKKKCLQENNLETNQQNGKNEVKSEINKALKVHKDELIRNNIIKDDINFGNIESENNIWGNDKWGTDRWGDSTSSNDETLPPLPAEKPKRKIKRKAKKHHFKPKKRRQQKKTTIEEKPPQTKIVKKKYGEKKYSCHLCGKYYTSYHMRCHLNRHNDIRPFICEYPDCGKAFHSVHRQRVHFKTVHSNFSFCQCEICGKQLKSKKAFDIHYSYHFDPKLPCNVCGKLIRNTAALKKHSLIHTGERRYKCEICSKQYKTRYAWKVHQRVHTKEKPYKCISCEQAFAYKCLLKAHITKYHTEITDDKS